MTHRYRLSGFSGIALMGLWLLLTLAAPARAGEPLIPTLLADHADAIRAALIAEGAPADAEISLSAPDAVIRISDAASFTVSSVSYNRATGRFLVRARGALGEPLVAVSGAAASPVTLPVPARDIPRGGVITEDDIDFMATTDGSSRQFIADAALMIGKETRRPLMRGEPIRASDLKSPILIKRGASVIIVLESPGLRLTQVSIALENGAEGDLIAFRNANSGTEIKASVVSPGLATAPFARGAERHAAFEGIR